MSSKWNIWDVKNRWLRAALAWVLAFVLVVAGAVLVAIAFVWFAIRGGFEGIRDGFADAFDSETRGLLRVSWAAMTARDYPGR